MLLKSDLNVEHKPDLSMKICDNSNCSELVLPRTVILHGLLKRCHDTQHNDTWHNDTQSNDIHHHDKRKCNTHHNFFQHYGKELLF
jgi:hypothetical protein